MKQNGGKLDLSSLAAALGSKPKDNAPAAPAPAAPTRLRAAVRAEAHREKGNDWFRMRGYEEALECYTASLNAVPGVARVLSNRSACLAALGRHAEALEDGLAAVQAEPEFARAHSRCGLALFHLQRFHEAAEAYGRAVALEPGNADACEGLERAQAAGGDPRRAAAERWRRAEAKKAGRTLAADADPSAEAAAAAATAAAASAAEARAAAATAAHAEQVARVQRQRRQAVQLWRASTGTELRLPEVDRGSSVRVDVFGTLRGACKRSGCRMWRRDLATATGGWCDTTVLSCQDCGAGQAEHEDCGPYQIDDPPPPQAAWAAENIKGVHSAHK